MTDLTERWLPVPGYEGLYEISDLGNVRSLPHPTPAGHRGGSLRKLKVDSGGYLWLSLWRDGKKTSQRVHRLVMLAFIGECPAGQQIRHGPGGMQDNRLVNLCYGTPQDDRNDMLSFGAPSFGEARPAAKLTDALVKEVRRRYAAGGVSQSDLAREYSVCRGTIAKAVTGKTWRHVGG
jgi:hypothetical protein